VSSSKVERVPWHSIVTLGLAAFAVVSAEFLPVGILPEIAGDNGVDLGTASLLVLIPGLIAGVSAPVIVTSAGHLDRKALVALLVVILLISDAGSWLVGGFGFLLLWRFLLGLSLGGFWAIGPSFSARLAPGRPAVATSIVIAGISAGTVLGLPLGTLIQAAVGWRLAFALQAAVAAVVLILVLTCLPSGTTSPPVRVRQLVAVVAAPASRAVLILTAISFTGQLVGSTFIGALLDEHFSSWVVTLLLLVYGAVGLGANLAAPRLGLPMPRLFAIATIVITAAFAGIAVDQHQSWVLIIAVVVWGALWGALPLIAQTWTMSSVPQAPEAGSAVLVTVIQLSIAAGSALGGIAVSVGGLQFDYALGALLFAVASVLVIFKLRRGRTSKEKAVPAHVG
jgi:predicted MFS family arabinose efflux permease